MDEKDYKTIEEIYITSDNYIKLKQLLDKGDTVICFIDFTGFSDITMRDICLARRRDKDDKEYDRYVFSSRGYCYYEHWTGEEHPFNHGTSFVEAMKKLNLRYIMPDL